jgi:hypothetical protein
MTERHVTLTLTDPEIEGLVAYVQWFGPAHTAECPADDTCACAGRALNAAVDAICQKAADAEIAREWMEP